MDNDLRSILGNMKNDRRGKPDAEFKKNARIRFLNLVREPQSEYRALPIRSVGLVYMRIAAFVIILLVLVSGGVVYTANFSASGGVFYPIRKAANKMPPPDEEGDLHRASPSSVMRPEQAPSEASPVVTSGASEETTAENERVRATPTPVVTANAAPKPTATAYPSASPTPAGVLGDSVKGVLPTSPDVLPVIPPLFR